MPEGIQKPEVQTGVSVISAERIEQAIMQRYSPLPDLTMGILAQQLNQFRVGDLRPFARTSEIMMERDGDLAVPADKLFSDIARLPWEIEKEDDSKEAEQDFETLKYFYTHLTATSVLEQAEIGGINLLLRQMMTAHAYQYSAHEIILQINDASKREITAQFNHAPVWFFESRKGQLAFLPREGEYYGQPLQPGQWLWAKGRGMMKQCSIAYFCKWGPMADWMFFSKRFGLPGVHGETNAAEGSKEWNDFEKALLSFINGFIIQTSGIGNNKVSLIEAGKGAGNTLPFKELIERSDRLYARCFRGGDLSTQSREGTDVAGANPQQGDTDLVLEDGGQWATDVLNSRVDEPLIAYARNRRPKAWIVIRPPKRKDSGAEINRLKAARDLKVPVSVDTARERLELPAPEEGAELISGAEPKPENATGLDPALANADEASRRVAEAAAEILRPILEAYDQRLQRILTITDPELRKQRWEALQAEMQTFEEDHLTDPTALVRLLEQINTRALVAGLKGKPQ
jgi:phage gp29-like protein